MEFNIKYETSNISSYKTKIVLELWIKETRTENTGGESNFNNFSF